MFGAFAILALVHVRLLFIISRITVQKLLEISRFLSFMIVWCLSNGTSPFIYYFRKRTLQRMYILLRKVEAIELVILRLDEFLLPFREETVDSNDVLEQSMTLAVDAALHLRVEARELAAQLNTFGVGQPLSVNVVLNAANLLNIEIDEDDIFI